MIWRFIFILIILGNILTQMPSPCPSTLIIYPRNETAKWYGSVVLHSQVILYAVFLEFYFDYPVQSMGNYFGEMDKVNSTYFVLNNRNFKLNARESHLVNFHVVYDEFGSYTPSVKNLRLNAIPICPPEGQDSYTTPRAHTTTRMTYNDNREPIHYNSSHTDNFEHQDRNSQRTTEVSNIRDEFSQISNTNSNSNSYNTNNQNHRPARPQNTNYNSNSNRDEYSQTSNTNGNSNSYNTNNQNHRPPRPQNTNSNSNINNNNRDEYSQTSNTNSNGNKYNTNNQNQKPSKPQNTNSNNNSNSNNRRTTSTTMRSTYNTNNINNNNNNRDEYNPYTQNVNNHQNNNNREEHNALSTHKQNNDNVGESMSNVFPGDFALIQSQVRPSSQNMGENTEFNNSRPQRQTQCGIVAQQPVGYILHAQNTTRGEWPWHVALYSAKVATRLEYICGGTLVSDRHVVTAAHCVTKYRQNTPVEKEYIQVQLGKYDLLKYDKVTSVGIKELTVHPQYENLNFFNDIAVLTLDNAVEFNDYITPVCLWEGKTDYEHIKNKLGTVVGWGIDESLKISNILKKTEMPIVSKETCIYSNRQFFSQYTHENNFCAGFKNGTSVCSGDSGSGMVFPRDGTRGSTTVWQLRGLVSLGIAQQGKVQCNANEYAIFTDVAKYNSFILSVMKRT